jgi:hypothetical protein
LFGIQPDLKRLPFVPKLLQLASALAAAGMRPRISKI